MTVALPGGNLVSETGTTDQTVIYNPLNKGYIGILATLGLGYALGGYFIAQHWLKIGPLDILLLLGGFLGLPLLIIGLGFYFGWKMKRSAITYNPPEWQFKPTNNDIIAKDIASIIPFIIISRLFL